MKGALVRGVGKYLICGVLVGATLAPVEIASAQKSKKDCRVVVCSLHGYEDPNKGSRIPLKLMNEIRSQLSSLPFKSYVLEDRKEVSVGYGQRATIPMNSGHGEIFKVNVTPSRSAQGRVELMLEWRDGSGADLLSTKMRVVNGKTVLLGSGAGAESSIIGVKLHCR